MTAQACLSLTLLLLAEARACGSIQLSELLLPPSRSPARQQQQRQVLMLLAGVLLLQTRRRSWQWMTTTSPWTSAQDQVEPGLRARRAASSRVLHRQPTPCLTLETWGTWTLQTHHTPHSHQQGCSRGPPVGQAGLGQRQAPLGCCRLRWWRPARGTAACLELLLLLAAAARRVRTHQGSSLKRPTALPQQQQEGQRRSPRTTFTPSLGWVTSPPTLVVQLVMQVRQVGVLLLAARLQGCHL